MKFKSTWHGVHLIMTIVLLQFFIVPGVIWLIVWIMRSLFNRRHNRRMELELLTKIARNR